MLYFEDKHNTIAETESLTFPSSKIFSSTNFIWQFKKLQKLRFSPNPRSTDLFLYTKTLVCLCGDKSCALKLSLMQLLARSRPSNIHKRICIYHKINPSKLSGNQIVHLQAHSCACFPFCLLSRTCKQKAFSRSDTVIQIIFKKFRKKIQKAIFWKQKIAFWYFD